MKRLRGLWLFSDLDGTLLSTPHASGGRYVELTSSPCLGPLRTWLLHGGNVCIVTTADHRVIQQVYPPLRDVLPDETNGKERGEERECRGELLLSLYCGSVLYRCTRQGIKSLPYVHPHAAHRSLTMSPTTASEVVKVVTEAFTEFAKDVLLGKEPAASSMQHLSHRYRAAWKALQKNLERPLAKRWASLESAGKALPTRPPWLKQMTNTDVDDAKRNTTEGNHDDSLIVNNHLREWQAKYLSGHPRILQTLGAVRCEYVTSDEALAKLVSRETDALRHYTTPMKDAQTSPDVVQVIVAGIPMIASQHYFSSCLPKLKALGVSHTLQPNSVVLYNSSVSKSTPLEYLTSKAPPPPERGMWGCVQPSCAVALGDHPLTVDRALTNVAGIPFVSLEKENTRTARHQAMSPSDVEAENHEWCFYGDEERGCARWLKAVINIMLSQSTINLHQAVMLSVQQKDSHAHM